MEQMQTMEPGNIESNDVLQADTTVKKSGLNVFSLLTLLFSGITMLLVIVLLIVTLTSRSSQPFSGGGMDTNSGSAPQTEQSMPDSQESTAVIN